MQYFRNFFAGSSSESTEAREGGVILSRAAARSSVAGGNGGVGGERINIGILFRGSYRDSVGIHMGII